MEEERIGELVNWYIGILVYWYIGILVGVGIGGCGYWVMGVKVGELVNCSVRLFIQE